jgi:hypothetical protein
MRRSPVFLLALLALVSACDTATPLCGEAGPACEPESDLVVAGVNLTELTREPTSAEVDSVLMRWRRQDGGTNPADTSALRTIVSTTQADGSRVRVLAGLDSETGDTLFFAGVHAPPRRNGDARLRPLVLVVPEGGTTTALETAPSPLPLLSVSDDVNYAVLAYPGQALRLGRRTYRATATPDPYGREVDEALAVLGRLRGDLTLGGHPDRTVAIGVGRGGTVALLASLRFPMKLVVAVQPPTTFFLRSVREDLARALRGEPLSPLPGMAHVSAESALAVRDGTRSLYAARLDLLARSPAVFPQPPGSFYVIATGNDVFHIPAQHGRTLAGRLDHTTSLSIETDDTTMEGILSNPSLNSFVSLHIRTHLL